MDLPYYPSVPFNFLGLPPEATAYDAARAVILPVPFERSTTYGAGTRNGPREIILASAQVELYDEETRTEAYRVGIHTLPDMELPHPVTEDALREIRATAAVLVDAGKFFVALGGEHSITPPIVEAIALRTAQFAAAPHPHAPRPASPKPRSGGGGSPAPPVPLSVLQIDAHADLRDSYMGNRNSHACAMRRVTEFARATQVGIRNLSSEEARALPSLPTQLFFDFEMRQDPDWIDRVVEALGELVYVTIDCDGLDPAIMPAVGTPEPGGLSWREVLALLRKVFTERRVIGADVVELAPIPGLLAPNFLCARLVYKMITYRFLKQQGRD